MQKELVIQDISVLLKNSVSINLTLDTQNKWVTKIFEYVNVEFFWRVDLIIREYLLNFIGIICKSPFEQRTMISGCDYGEERRKTA